MIGRGKLVAALCLSFAACTEPVDCAREPARCPGYVRAPAMAAAPRPAPAALLAPIAPTAPAALAVPVRGGQRYLQVPVDGQAPNRRPDQEPLAVQVRPGAVPAGDKPIQPGAPSQAEALAVMRAVEVPAESRNFEGLKPLITTRLYDTLQPLLEKNGPRLWTHLDHYKTALAANPVVTVESVEGGKVQTRVPVPGAQDLRPILEKVGGSWKIDRF